MTDYPVQQTDIWLDPIPGYRGQLQIRNMWGSNKALVGHMWGSADWFAEFVAIDPEFVTIDKPSDEDLWKVKLLLDG